VTTEAYIPSDVRFAGRSVEEMFALTLHDPDGEAPHGSLTTHHPLREAQRGALEVIGRRDGKTWRVTLDEIEVCRATPVGCEFTIFGSVKRQKLDEQAGKTGD
jgi:hypothetical protein